MFSFKILNNKTGVKNVSKSFGMALSAGVLIYGFTGAALTFVTYSTGPAFAEAGLHEGSKAPDFTLFDEEGKPVKLSDFKGKHVVVFFYDETDAPMTEKEAKVIQKYYSQYKLKNADVLGIGSNPVASHKAMHTNLQLDFHLLTDKDGKVKKIYHLGAEQHGRYGVVVDKNGVIKKMTGIPNEGISEKTVTDTLDVLNSLPGGGI